jgi:hypothetical protein
VTEIGLHPSNINREGGCSWASSQLPEGRREVPLQRQISYFLLIRTPPSAHQKGMRAAPSLPIRRHTKRGRTVPVFVFRFPSCQEKTGDLKRALCFTALQFLRIRHFILETVYVSLCPPKDPSRWPRGILYPQKLALTSPTTGGRSSGIVCSQTQTTEFVLVCLLRTISC